MPPSAGWLSYSDVHGDDNTVSGTVYVWPSLGAPALGRSAEILVYVPPSLAAGDADSVARRYPTLYFHDGQNVFDERTSNGGEWHADETLEMLAGEGLEAIAVAVPNGGDARMDEYNPWRGPSIFDAVREMGGLGDAYLEWLVSSVKPLVDRSFPTRAEAEATGIIGSSMGGLISLYGLLTNPGVFGLAGVMSPSLGWNDYAVLRLVEDAPLPAGCRVHVDMGGREWRGMLADARRLRDALLGTGMRQGIDLHYVEERHAPHNEAAWARRLPDALRFLLADLQGA